MLQYIDRRLDAAFEQMVAFCRSCAAVTERGLEQRGCAEWLVEELRGVGFNASVRDTPSRQIAVGHDRGSRGHAVLFCAHYGALPARAASQCIDEHCAQLMAFVEACRAWKTVAGQLPTSVSVLVTGEPRSGSALLTSFLHMYADELKANIGLAPGVQISPHTIPTINTMLRGLCCEEFTVFAGNSDQPAGSRGSPAVTPTLILARILGDLHDNSGQLALPGFYTGVEAPLPPQRDPSHDAPCDTADLARALDDVLPEYKREAGATGKGSVWPTCEVDNVGSIGSDGERGTAISLYTFAKLSFHLVWNQDPDVIRRAFRDFARARVPPGFQIEFMPGTSARPALFAIANPAFSKVRHALTDAWGREAVYACGDAAPIVHAVREALGTEVIVTSFPGLQGYRLGSWESPELARYRVSIHSWARILAALSR